MIFAPLSSWRNLPGLSQNRIWTVAFEWLETKSATAPEDYHPLGSDKFYARVMKYPLKERHNAAYESHHHTIDIQYTVEGSEGIEFCDLAKLTSLQDYSAENDTEHFKVPIHGNALVDNTKGWFAVIFPNEPHMPQLRTATSSAVHKVVIKIPYALL